MTIDGLQDRLTELAEKFQVPGASVAVLADGRVQEAATGVVNKSTGVAATPDSLFQPGSIGKVYTATLAMRLVEEGLLELDEPIRTRLPEFRVADPEVTERVTLRHILAHTSGMDGDFLIETGRGDDCLERYVERCATLAQNHPLGATMSYCNSGYLILGRLIEVVTGQVWDAAFKDRLLDPLGLTETVTLPEDALRFNTALGHLSENPGDEPVPAPLWGMMRNGGPAGANLCATAREVLALGRLHLDGGVAPDGTRLLSQETVAAMQEPQVEVPDRWTLGSHWGLGWILFDWDGKRLYGHDGNTIGQAGFLRVVPDDGVAVALLTNGGETRQLYEHLFTDVLSELAGVSVPAPLSPPAKPVTVDLDRYVGLYERASVRMDVEKAGGELRATISITGELAQMMPQPPVVERLVPLDADLELFVGQAEGDETWGPTVFFELDGRRYVHSGVRATPKVV